LITTLIKILNLLSGTIVLNINDAVAPRDYRLEVCREIYKTII
jgi:hypothetical protein